MCRRDRSQVKMGAGHEHASTFEGMDDTYKRRLIR